MSSADAIRALVIAVAALAAMPAVAQIAAAALVDDGIPGALATAPGDVARGRAIVADRQKGLCLLCHSAPIAEQRFQGDLAPDLAGTGARWTEAQLRLRLVDSSRINPATIMPAYHRTDGFARVGPAYRGRPILSAQEIEDVVAYLASLR